MIVDSSVLVAVLRMEPDASVLLQALRDAPTIVLGAPTLLETSLVIGPDRHGDLDALLAGLGAVVVPFTPEQARIARRAYERYGRSSGSPAKLNFGDVMSYAVAKESSQPLLFKGDDFTHTDIERAS